MSGIMGPSTQSMVDNIMTRIREDQQPVHEAAAKVNAFSARMDVVEAIAADVDNRVDTATADIFDLTADNILARARTYDVASFGAKGDGVTDDTAAIQAAVDAIPTTGGIGGATLVFSFGEYLISSTIHINQHGVRLESSGGFTAALVATAALTGPMIEFSIPNSIMRGPQIRNLRLTMNAGNASGVYMRSPYDNAMIENLFITGLGGSAYGVKIDVQTGASAPVAQTLTAINCWLSGRTGYTGTLWDLENLQEATFITCKGVGADPARVNGTAFHIKGGRSLAFYNCSTASVGSGYKIEDSFQPAVGITIDNPLFEHVGQPLVVNGSAANTVIDVVMRNPRAQSTVGASSVKNLARGSFDMNNMQMTVDSANGPFTVTTYSRANITDNGPATQIVERRASASTRPGISPGLNLFGSQSPMLNYEVSGRSGYHRLFWFASSALDNGFYHTMSNGTNSWNMHHINASGHTQSYYVWNGSVQVETLRLERLPAVGKTGVYIATNRAGTVTLQQVEVGEVDSGGTGYRVLRIPN